MRVLAGVFVVALLYLVSTVLASKKRHSLSPVLVSWKALFDNAIQSVSTVGEHLDELREIFRPRAYAGVAAAVFPLARIVRSEEANWSPTVRAMLRDRARRAQSHIARMEKNIERFEQLGLHASLFTLGEDPLAQEVLRKATGCKLLLHPVKRRVRIYNAMPLFIWRIMGGKMAHTCVYGGAQLIQEYEGLVDAVLVFVRARGDDYHYDTLLAAL